MVDRAILRRVNGQLGEENSELRELLRHYIQSLSASRELSEAGMNSVRWVVHIGVFFVLMGSFKLHSSRELSCGMLHIHIPMPYLLHKTLMVFA